MDGIKPNQRSVRRWILNLLRGLLPSLAILLCSCHAPERRPTPDLLNTSPAKLHVVKSDELKAIMQRLNRQSFSRMPQELDQEDQSRSALKQISRVAPEIENSASQISSLTASLDLSAANEDTFRLLIKALKLQASELARHSRRGNLSETQATLSRVNATCVQCHSLFRSPTSEVPSLR